MHGRIHRGRQGVQTPSPILILIDLFALEVVILGHRAWADLKGRTSGPDTLPPTDSDRLVCARSCDLSSSCMSGSIGEDRWYRPPTTY